MGTGEQKQTQAASKRRAQGERKKVNTGGQKGKKGKMENEQQENAPGGDTGAESMAERVLRTTDQYGNETYCLRLAYRKVPYIGLTADTVDFLKLSI